jgi:F0F1-type ATP synthase membrane subunit b/b'
MRADQATKKLEAADTVIREAKRQAQEIIDEADRVRAEVEAKNAEADARLAKLKALTDTL